MLCRHSGWGGRFPLFPFDVSGLCRVHSLACPPLSPFMCVLGQSGVACVPWLNRLLYGVLWLSQMTREVRCAFGDPVARCFFVSELVSPDAGSVGFWKAVLPLSPSCPPFPPTSARCIMPPPPPKFASTCRLGFPLLLWPHARV